ncbi:DUF945 family protein [Litoribrevibacter albus]|uniref:DUF945 family protein n=1 Tax=Litoribrevibacter albus TaxID=1473156 RepID=A0AA37SA18_9GAMM|nr:DUF945 family protein [Litoribrevibacter albus]GLQ32077.1 hypothetical protein GCM10007876_25560 [Litoribrevibacter albus]
MPFKKSIYAALIVLALLVFVVTPGLLGTVAKHYIERAVYLNNLNTAVTIELRDYEKSWFESHFILDIYTQDEFEEELVKVGSFPATLKHGPVTVINNQPGIGAFYLYSDSFESVNLTTPYIGYARAGFLGQVELNINIDLQSLNQSQNTPKSTTGLELSPLILSIDSDFEFERINYQILWPGFQDKNRTDTAQVENVLLTGHVERIDDLHWQGKSNASIKRLTFPANDFILNDLNLTLENFVTIDESSYRTLILAHTNAKLIKSLWNDWQQPELDVEIHNADLQAFSNLYDLAERAYLEFDSPFDEYAQLEYMAALQTSLPALFSDNATIKLKHFTFTDAQSNTEKEITGEIQFPDLPDYMDEHLISLIAKTNGTLKRKTSNGTNTIEIKNGKVTIDNRPLDFSILN